MSEVERRCFVYGTRHIDYELSYEPRKTLGITVHPDLLVSIKAPLGTPLSEIETVLARRARWIVQRLDDYARYSPELPPREYVSGETHRYLGRQYRLRVTNGQSEGVSLDGQFLIVTVHPPDGTKKADRARVLVQHWYRAHAREVLADRLAACYPRLEPYGVAKPRLTIRRMHTRWGSASPRGRITLNLKLVQVPARLIDYVVLHELCHLVEPHHGPAFYALLGRILPDWREKREALNRYEFG